jgi:CheY-like chemotaxis protein/anti-sigma regulatory factor (Ser/Thr protein kinase)
LQAVVEPTVAPISGDAARLQQVIWNLLSNAIKFTPRGGRVEVTVEETASRARITVADNGKGIDPAFLPFVFERFRQADSSSTRAEGGLGLGLAIVRHLVELHGGTVEAESAGPGRGTTIRVNLPVSAVRIAGNGRHVGAVVRPTGVSPGAFTLTGVRVLVVDDDFDARVVVSAVLEGAGATVVAVPSAEEALGALDFGVPDVLVSDIGMPAADGIALICDVRRLAEERGRVPALALTAYAGSEDDERALAAGYQAYLTKPIEAEELIHAVARLAKRAGD